MDELNICGNYNGGIIYLSIYGSFCYTSDINIILNTVKLRKIFLINHFTNLEFLTVNILLQKLEGSTAMIRNIIFLNLGISAIDYRHIPSHW